MLIARLLEESLDFLDALGQCLELLDLLVHALCQRVLREIGSPLVHRDSILQHLHEVSLLAGWARSAHGEGRWLGRGGKIRGRREAAARDAVALLNLNEVRYHHDGLTHPAHAHYSKTSHLAL